MHVFTNTQWSKIEIIVGNQQFMNGKTGEKLLKFVKNQHKHAFLRFGSR